MKKFVTPFLVFLVFAYLTSLPALSGASRLSVSEAHQLASRGEVILVDVRAPAEWDKTGIGTSAKPISMHLPGFFDKIKAAVKGDKSRPIALICATGSRSSLIQAKLSERGYTNTLDVAEGMMGSSAGPGWIASGLPVQKP